jgi:peptidoglycan/LPS O-acetylase OafA/YrhL
MRDEPVRHDFLDWLRVLAIAVLLFYHTGMLFVGWGWHIENAEFIEALRRPMDIAHRLRMPLLFVIAGAGMWFALRRRSGGQVLRERSLRLLVPIVIGMLLIVPPQIYFERLFRGQWHGGYFDFFFQRVLQLQPYPQGDFSWHHLWFIVYLYVYVLLLLPALLWWRHQGFQLRPGKWLYALAAPLAINEALLKPLFPESHNLTSDWYIFNHYLLLTFYGWLLASMSDVWDWLMHQRRIALGCAVSLLAVGLPLLDAGIIPRDTAFDATLANIFTWLSLMTFFGYGRRYLSFSNRLLEWSRDASYPIYILHQTIIIAVGYWVIQQVWNPWVKYGVVLLSTICTCAIIYDLVVRRFVVTRLMFGMKPSTGLASQTRTAVGIMTQDRQQP